MRFCAVVFLFLTSFSTAGDVPLPTQVAQRKAPPGLEGLVWNKWDTKHFSVLSIDKADGRAVQSVIESERHGVLRKWSVVGSDDFYCKLVCVRDALMLKKMFSIDEPLCEVRMGSDGRPAFAAIWIDHDRMSVLPSLLLDAELTLGDYPLHLRRGMPLVERSNSFGSSLEMASNSPCSSLLDRKSSESLFKERRDSFDADSAILCLMVRKELGSSLFARFVYSKEGEAASSLGFSSSEEMDKTFDRFRGYLLEDLKAGKTPVDYLTIPGK